jgi:hypothetical protein
MPVRTPDGEVYDDGELEQGKECVRCSAFIPVRSDLPPKPDTADYSDLRVQDYAGTGNRVIGDEVSGDLCPECREEFGEWLQDGGDAEGDL